MNIAEIFGNLSAEIQLKLQEAQAQAEQYSLDQYNKGLSEGLTQTGVDKIYSQAELEQKIAEALLPLNEELSNVKAELEALKLEVENKVLVAVNGLKAALLAKYEEQQVAENAIETGFKELLNP